MKTVQYNIKRNITLKNRFNNDTVVGDIVNEKDIDGKQYYVVMVPNRHNAQLSFAKESWSITKGK